MGKSRNYAGGQDLRGARDFRIDNVNFQLKRSHFGEQIAAKRVLCATGGAMRNSHRVWKESRWGANGGE